MSLTGIPVIALAVLVTVGALAATILVWNRARRFRLPQRTVGVLLTEALLLITIGLVVNRSELFYPNWADLLTSGSSGGTSYSVTPGRLDSWLQGRAGVHRDQDLTFAWQPTGWTDWHLAGAPTVVIPAAYLLHPAWRYSVVVVVDDATSGWTPATQAAAADAAGASVVVFARVTDATAGNTLATTVPAALSRDLRVTTHRWALVTSGLGTSLAEQAIAAAAARYPAIAVVQRTSPPTAAAGRTAVFTSAPPIPAGIAVAVVGPTATRPATRPATPPAAGQQATAQPIYLKAPASTVLQSALTWAGEQTPPPLAASTPATTHVPVHHRRHAHRAHGAARRSCASTRSCVFTVAGVVAKAGGKHVSGQPRH